MFDSKSPIVKAVGYIVIGFFLLIIIISFGMPNIMPQAGMDPGTVALVNGQKLNAMDFLRFRDSMLRQYQNFTYNKFLDGMILDRFISRELMYKYAEDLGLNSSDERVGKTLKQWFTDADTGKYNPEILKSYLERSNQSFASFENTVRHDMTLNDLQTIMYEGTAISFEELKTEYACRNTKLRIRYAFLSEGDMKKRFASQISVSDADIDEDMRAHPEELKDPKTDRDRIKNKLELNKFTKAENDLIERINEIAERQGSFAASADMLGGIRGISAIFAPGEQVKEEGDNGRDLSPLVNSDIFRETCMTLNANVSSKAVRTSAGIYVFTPVLKRLNVKEPSDEDLENLRNEISYQMANFSIDTIALKLHEEAKIIKNLETGE